MATGGSVESVTLDGRTFSVAADADSQRKLGGFENEVVANGDGSARLLKTRVPWGFSDLTLYADDTAGDHEFLQALADRNDFFPITVTLASGVIYQGTGQVAAENPFSSATATVAVSLMGAGILTKQ